MSVKIVAPRQTLYRYRNESILNYKPKGEVKEWFNENKINYRLKYELHEYSNPESLATQKIVYYFLFKDESDATLFMLRWS